MSLKPLNSVGGYSIGDLQQTTIVDSTGNISNVNTATIGTIQSSNLVAGTSNIKLTSGGNLAVSVGGTSDVLVVSTTGANVVGNLSISDTALVANVNSGASNLTLTSNGNSITLAAGTANTTFPGNIVTTGNVYANWLVGNIQGSVSAAGANTDVLFNDNGVTNATSGLQFNKSTNTLSVANALSVTGNIGAGNVTATQIISNVADGTAPLVVSSQTKVANLNADLLDGYDSSQTVVANTVVVRNADGNVAANYFIGNGAFLTGIDTSLIANGTSNVAVPASNGNVVVNVNGALVATFSANTITTSGNVAAGAVKTDNLMYANGTPWDFQLPGGTNTQIQFNDNGDFGGTAAFTFNKTSNVLSLAGTANVTTLNATGNVSAGNVNSTAAVTAATVAATGNVSGGNLSATGLVSSATLSVTGNANVGNLGTAGLITATGNITGGNLTTAGLASSGTLNVTGNANVGNIGATAGIFTGNITSLNANLGNLAAANYISVANDLTIGSGSGGNITGANIISANLLTGTLTTAAQPNITSVGTLSTLTVSGNANVGNIGATNGVFTNVSGNGALLTNITGANVTGQVANALVAGTVYTNAQPNITSVGTLTSLTVSGTANAGNLTTSGTLNVTGNSTLGNVNGNIAVFAGNLTAANAELGNLASANFLQGQLTSTAQPSIQSVGTLIGLQVNGTANITDINSIGNVTANTVVANLSVNTPLVQSGNSNIALTPNGNVSISSAGNANVVVVTGTGANVNGYLTVTGNVTAPTFFGNLVGNFSGNITVPGSNTQILFNDDGLANATSAFTFDKVTNTLSVNGNANVSNLNASNNVVATGNVSGNNLSITNLANVGSLEVGTNANVVGNIGANNVTLGNSLTAGANVQANGNVITDSIVGRTDGVTITSAGANANITLVPSGNATVNVSGKRISNVAEPSADTDAATKAYVDSIAQGLHVHAPSYAATTASLATLSGGGTITYNNGTGGVGANLVLSGGTSNFTSANFFDGNVTAVATNRILVKNETNAAHNGIYVVTSSTVLTRAADFDTSTEMAGGDFTFVQYGDTYNDTGWVMTDPVTTVGTSPVNWVQFSGAGTYSAGTGLVLNGSVFSIANTTVTPGSYGSGDAISTFTVNQQGQLTAAGTTPVTANAANLTGTVLASGVVTSSLTSVGTLGNLSVTGNTTSGNFIGTLANGTSKVSMPVAGGNIDISVAGNANVAVITGTGVNVAGYLTATGNVTGGNIDTAGAITATGNLTAGNISSLGTLSAVGNANVGNLGAAAGVFTANVSAANVVATNNVTANVVAANNQVTIGNTHVGWATVTTSAATANQTIVQFPHNEATAAEFIVKGVDGTAKYSVQTVQAITNNAQADYSVFGTVFIGGSPGSLAVNIVGSNIALQVTPSSSNSTVWTVQYRAM